MERPVDRPLDRTPSDRPVADRSYDRGYERGNGYDNLDGRYPYDERYDRYNPSPARRQPPYDEYGPPRYDRFNGNARNQGRYDSRYDRYDPYDRSGYNRRPMTFEDRYDDR